MTPPTFQKPLVVYDGSCGICAGNLPWLYQLDWLHIFEALPYQSEDVYKRHPGLTRIQCEEALQVAFPDGQIFSGADAFRHIFLRMPLMILFGIFMSIPPLPWILRKLYPVIARNRYRLGGRCAVGEHSSKARFHREWLGWLPLIGLPACVFSFRSHVPAWVFMWALSFAIYVGFKWLTWWQTSTRESNSIKRSLAYLFLWPGMDAESFLGQRTSPSEPHEREWLFAVCKTVFGGLLFWFAARHVPSEWTLLQGWIGLFGLIFLLHFGSFHFLALFWHRKGVPVIPLMKAPALATSLSDFWSHRWNLAFRQLAYGLAFKPLHKKLGTTGAMFISFLASGLIHELVISVPARGGYGLPTLYFLLQATGIASERTKIGQIVGLGSGVRGWAFTLLVAAGPAFWLFHPAFIHRVVIPFMEAANAL